MAQTLPRCSSSTDKFLHEAEGRLTHKQASAQVVKHKTWGRGHGEGTDISVILKPSECLQREKHLRDQ